MAKATAILLAAGEGKRMVSKKQKVMHNLCGRPMLGWVMRSVQQHITERPIVVLGFDGESVKDYFGKDCTYAYQQNVPGNRVDALRAGMSAVNADTGYVLVMAGNMPLITDRTVAAGGGRKGLFSLQTHMLFGRRGYADIPGVLL